MFPPSPSTPIQSSSFRLLILLAAFVLSVSSLKALDSYTFDYELRVAKALKPDPLIAIDVVTNQGSSGTRLKFTKQREDGDYLVFSADTLLFGGETRRALVITIDGQPSQVFLLTFASVPKSADWTKWLRPDYTEKTDAAWTFMNGLKNFDRSTEVPKDAFELRYKITNSNPSGSPAKTTSSPAAAIPGADTAKASPVPAVKPESANDLVLDKDLPPGLAAYGSMAAKGDAKAMITIGLAYYEGTGVPQDYGRALDWFLRAYDKGNGDAVNNIGVMFRDGQAVAKNEKIAYLLFLEVYMTGLGDESTQIRAGRNLSRLADSLPKTDQEEALSYTLPYLDQVVRSKGKNMAVGKDVLPSAKQPRIKDNNWWLDSERKKMDFKSPPPWN